MGLLCVYVGQNQSSEHNSVFIYLYAYYVNAMLTEVSFFLKKGVMKRSQQYNWEIIQILLFGFLKSNSITDQKFHSYSH